MRVLVTGSRQWLDQKKLYDELDAVFIEWMRRAVWDVAVAEDGFTVVHGNAPGADTLANQWVWDKRGEAFTPSVEVHPAQWAVHGRRLAGKIRNTEMVKLGADIVLAFFVPGAANNGTRHCVKTAESWLAWKGVPIKEIWER